MIQLKPATLTPEYRKQWNVHMDDFVHVYVNDVKVSDTLYRIGGLGCNFTNKYIMLLKYVEEHYKDSITTDKTKKPHLAGHWCILDNNTGKEKVVFEEFKNPYLSGGVIYSLENKYYNIETQQLYCTSYDLMGTDKFLFLNNRYDEDTTKRGVMKINKTEGTFELYQ